MTKEEEQRIARGNVAILLSKLEESERHVVKDLKNDKSGNVPYLQGISYVTDRLIEVLRNV